MIVFTYTYSSKIVLDTLKPCFIDKVSYIITINLGHAACTECGSIRKACGNGNGSAF